MSHTEDMLRVTTGDGKYTVIQNGKGALRALRHGEEWRELVGDGLVLSLAYDLEAAREEITKLQAQIDGTAPEKVQCPDGGTCHHGCTDTCFWVTGCAPLSNLYPNDQWPADIIANPAPQRA